MNVQIGSKGTGMSGCTIPATKVQMMASKRGNKDELRVIKGKERRGRVPVPKDLSVSFFVPLSAESISLCLSF